MAVNYVSRHCVIRLAVKAIIRLKIAALTHCNVTQEATWGNGGK